jgi:hypothetical protein
MAGVGIDLADATPKLLTDSAVQEALVADLLGD